MKKIYLAFIASIFINSAFSQVTPNSNRFDVENYIAIDNNGNYYPYTVHGFYENAASGATYPSGQPRVDCIRGFS